MWPVKPVWPNWPACIKDLTLTLSLEVNKYSEAMPVKLMCTLCCRGWCQIACWLIMRAGVKKEAKFKYILWSLKSTGGMEAWSEPGKVGWCKTIHTQWILQFDYVCQHLSARRMNHETFKLNWHKMQTHFSLTVCMSDNLSHIWHA